MKARKTIKAKIISPTVRKLRVLELEYGNWQKYLRGDKTVKLHSATKQQADRLLKRLRRVLKDKEYPLIIRRDCFRVDVQETKLTKYWAKVPTHKGGVFVPIIPHEPLEGLETREAKLLKKDGNGTFI